ncbi:hypothetical protein EDC01DRAFT_635724 [Geopyxis carbonaria]|nr:hypothetical protein EDC01DRAFT_635724 [Geopyxis carbonaria]
MSTHTNSAFSNSHMTTLLTCEACCHPQPNPPPTGSASNLPTRFKLCHPTRTHKLLDSPFVELHQLLYINLMAKKYNRMSSSNQTTPTPLRPKLHTPEATPNTPEITPHTHKDTPLPASHEDSPTTPEATMLPVSEVSTPSSEAATISFTTVSAIPSPSSAPEPEFEPESESSIISLHSLFNTPTKLDFAPATPQQVHSGFFYIVPFLVLLWALRTYAPGVLTNVFAAWDVCIATFAIVMWVVRYHKRLRKIMLMLKDIYAEVQIFWASSLFVSAVLVAVALSYLIPLMAQNAAGGVPSTVTAVPMPTPVAVIAEPVESIMPVQLTLHQSWKAESVPGLMLKALNSTRQLIPEQLPAIPNIFASGYTAKNNKGMFWNAAKIGGAVTIPTAAAWITWARILHTTVAAATGRPIGSPTRL